MNAEFPRPLTQEERSLLTFILGKFLPRESRLLEQLSQTVVTNGCPCGCPTIDLWTEEKSAPPLSDARLLWQGTGRTAKNLLVIVSLLQTAGQLSSFDVAYSCDEACADLPRPDTIEEFPPATKP